VENKCADATPNWWTPRIEPGTTQRMQSRPSYYKRKIWARPEKENFCNRKGEEIEGGRRKGGMILFWGFKGGGGGSWGEVMGTSKIYYRHSLSLYHGGEMGKGKDESRGIVAELGSSGKRATLAGGAQKQDGQRDNHYCWPKERDVEHAEG